jgi:hypothetical protein
MIWLMVCISGYLLASFASASELLFSSSGEVGGGGERLRQREGDY